jgi:hypothetical protein
MNVLRGALIVLLALVSMAHVGSPDTFYSGKAGPYDIRVSVRLPGVIPGRAQVTVRVAGTNRADAYRVSLRAGQWNVGLKGAPPPEPATPVPGDPALYAAELWFMTSSSYEMAVDVSGPSGDGSATVPVLAVATAERTMPPWLGAVLTALGLFLTAGLLTLVGVAVRESVLPPGQTPDQTRRRRARYAVAAATVLMAVVLWGGYAWWEVEARAYRERVRYRPFDTLAAVRDNDGSRVMTLSIRDPRWNGSPNPANRFNALMPDHGKLMHLFLVREDGLDAFAHLHPVARSPEALDFDTALPALPSGRYRVYGDIVHESGYAQTLTAAVDVIGESRDDHVTEETRHTVGVESRFTDADDSWFGGRIAAEAETELPLSDGSRLVWNRDAAPFLSGQVTVLSFAVRDAAGTVLDVEPYMGMAAHIIVASHDHRVFAHLHPSGSISMAALQKFTNEAASTHAGHNPAVESSAVEVPYAFPVAGKYRMWIQFKRGGIVQTAAFDLAVQ